jgi:hypothetical protein
MIPKGPRRVKTLSDHATLPTLIGAGTSMAGFVEGTYRQQITLFRARLFWQSFPNGLSNKLQSSRRPKKLSAFRANSKYELACHECERRVNV